MSYPKGSVYVAIDGRNIFDLILSQLNQSNYLERYVRIVESLERLIQDIDSPNISFAVMTRMSYWFYLAQTSGPNVINQIDIEPNRAYLRRSIESLFMKESKCVEEVDKLLDATFFMISKVKEIKWAESHRQDMADFGGLQIMLRRIYKLFKEIVKNLGGCNKKEMVGKINNIIPGPVEGWSPNKEQLIHETYNEQEAKIEDMSSLLERNMWAERELEELREIFYMTADALDSGGAPIDITDLQWVMRIKFKGAENKPHKIGYLLQCLGYAFSSIEGVELNVGSWGVGSLWADIVMKFKDVFARDEVQQILENVQEGFVDTSQIIGESVEVALHDKPISEMNKIIAETDKLHLEAEKLKKEVESTPDTDIIKKLAIEEAIIEVEMKKTELRKKQIENNMLEIDLIKKASDLIRDGVIKQDEISIDINGLVYLTKIDGEVKRGYKLAEIKKVPEQLMSGSSTEDLPENIDE